MDEYMSASDLIVGKPGGLTTSEAMAKNLIFVDRQSDSRSGRTQFRSSSRKRLRDSLQ
jgi:UDP-N-acetylglucosamine:LPS N-acetylglucosamine transferase